MNDPNYEKLYDELVSALGYDSERVKKENLQNKAIEAAKILRRVAVTMQTYNSEQSGALFVCGIRGEHDSMGLPEYLDVCPTFGMQGIAVYKKFKDYSEPGW